MRRSLTSRALHRGSFQLPPASRLASAVSQALLVLASSSAQALVVVSGSYQTNIPEDEFNGPDLRRPDAFLWLGAFGPASLSASAGAQVQLSTLAVGSNVGKGSALITGSNTRLELLGTSPGGRLAVGGLSDGELTVTNYAVLEATGNGNTQCYFNPVSCQIVVGGSAGVAGNFRVQDNARASLVGTLVIGSPWVQNQYTGTPGGTGTGSVRVLSGGKLEAEVALAGVSFNGPGGSGTERSRANILVEGSGSVFTIRAGIGSIGNGDTFLSLASGPLANTTLNVLQGGKVSVEGSSLGEYSLHVGQGGMAEAFVRGENSNLRLTGDTSRGVFVIGDGSKGSLELAERASLFTTARTFNLGVGPGGDGGLSVKSGAKLEAQTLTLGLQLGSANLTVDGVTDYGNGQTSPSFVELSGVGVRRLSLGQWGSANALISNGAVLDAASNSNACVGKFCSSAVGVSAGSTAQLWILDPGSRASFIGGLAIGGVDVRTASQDGWNEGTPGGTTNAKVFVLNAGALKTDQVFVGGSLSPSGNREEFSSSELLVSGPGSQWLVTGSKLAGLDAVVLSGTQHRSFATWEISDRGTLRIEAESGSGRDAHLRLAHGGGESTMVVKDAGSLLQLKGGIASIGVGENGGTGTLEISQGAKAIIDGSTDSYIDIGMPNSVGEVIVAGGELSGARRLTVGADGRGSLSVTSGGQVRSETASVDGWPGGAESVVRVSGPQSLWEVTGNGGSGQFAMLSTGRSPASRARVEVKDGGVLRIAAEAAGEAHLRLAHGGGTSTLLLQGADEGGHGSRLDVIGNVATINVGENGGKGVLEIRQGASTFLQGVLDSAVDIGLPGSVGEVRVVGGDLRGAERIVVGAGGTGSIAISEGGQVRSSFGTVDGWAPVSTPLVTISGPSSRWLVTGSISSGAAAMVRTGTWARSETRWDIDGGGQLEVRAWEGLEAHLRLAHGGGTSTMRVTGADANGVASQLNVIGKVASINVGESGGTARLEISDRAQTFIGGVLDSYLNIGMPGSSGEVMITGGILVGAQRINVGFGGNGLLQLEGGGQLAYTSRVSVGSDGGRGTLDVRGPHTQVALEGAVTSLLIGSTGGIGEAVISSGAVATLYGNAHTELVIGDSQGQPAASMTAGRGSVRITGASQLRLESGPQGEVVAVVGKGHAGALDLDGGSLMVLAPGRGGASQLVVGQGSTGVMTLAGGSRVDVLGGAVRIANAPDTRGELVLREGSRLEASYVGIGGAGSVFSGACGYINVLDTSVLKAGTLEAGACGHISGNGTIEADIDLSGTLGPGNSPGSLKIIGNLTARPGSRIELEIGSDSAGGFKTDELIFVDGAQIYLAGAEISFRFLGMTDPNAFQSGGGFRIDQFFARGATGELDHNLFDGVTFTASADAYAFSSFSFTAEGGAAFSAVAVPEPAAWALMLVGLAIMTARARQQARH